MTIWVVLYDAYGDFWVNRVYSTEDAAKAFVGDSSGYRIEQVKLR